MRAVALALLVVLAGCTGAPLNEQAPGQDAETVGSNIERVVDEEAGVVCYKHKPTGDIDCVPIEETRLHETEAGELNLTGLGHD